MLIKCDPRKVSHRCDAQPSSDSTWGHQEENRCSNNGSQTLSGYVEQALCKTQLPGDHHGGGDGWVDVASADVTETLHHGSDAQAETQRDEHQVCGRRVLCACRPADGGTQAQENKDQSGQEFTWDGAPEGLRPNVFKSHHDALTAARW